MSDEKTEKAGSEPEVKDANKPDANADPSTAPKDADKEKSSASEEELPWHKDARFKNDLGLLKAAKSLMEANGIDDVDDLKDLVDSGRKIHGKSVDLGKLDEIIQKAARLDSYEKYWQQQAELNREKGETPEQTIARLKKENEELNNSNRQRDTAEKETKEARKAVEFYEGEVSAFVEQIEGVSKPEQEFLKWALGIGNECNDITITDKKQIKRVVNAGAKKLDQLIKAVREDAVQQHIKSQENKTPAVPSTNGTGTTTEAAPLKGLRNLRSAFMEQMKKSGG